MVQVEAARHLVVCRPGVAAQRRIPYRPVTPPPRTEPADVVVVGAGAAGLHTALVAAGSGARVALVSSSPLAQSASFWAQGGLAAALDPEDTVDLHLADTLAAGRGATSRRMAQILCAEAPGEVRELERLGISFDRSPQGQLLLSLEGGHTRRRVAHAGGSATGRHVTARLSELVTADDRVEVHERTTAHALWVEDGRCAGVVTESLAIPAAATVLATGGAAALWQRTTNPRGAIGSGLTLAAEAGAALADLEFMQFHPTAVATEGELDGFLVTEAVRGDGALLVTDAGERFVDELAPRDEVTLAIESVMRAGGRALLDLRPVDMRAFPNIVERLAAGGFDPQRDLVPVAPAAHYMIGGIVTDERGRSRLPGLYAVGECASTGVHGANRLASNSLSECFVFGRRAALCAVEEPAPLPAGPPPAARPPVRPDESTRAALWRDAGPARDAGGLERLAADPYPLARLIARSALERRESRGCHLRTDYPAVDPELDRTHTVLTDSHSSRETWA
jgi:L-aspartate oxidase